jgi:hypothetical protein
MEFGNLRDNSKGGSLIPGRGGEVVKTRGLRI